MLIFGKPIAEKILSETKEKIKNLGIIPGLAVVLVGNDPASRIYVRVKETRARELGFHFVKRELPETTPEKDVLDAVRSFNADPAIHGIIVQLPLPEEIDTDRIIATIDSAKDADGFLVTDRIPVFPEAMIELAKSVDTSLTGKTGIVLANSKRFGTIMTEALGYEGVKADFILNCDLNDKRQMMENADLVFSALGKSEILSRNIFKRGAVVIDGGIKKRDGRMVGDVSSEGDDEGISLSPVPGGVGPVTVACLLRRTMELAITKKKTA